MSGFESARLWTFNPDPNLQIQYHDSEADITIASDTDREEDDPQDEFIDLDQHRERHLNLLNLDRVSYITANCNMPRYPQRKFIISPTASELQHVVIDPAVYRELRSIHDLEDLASKLNFDDNDTLQFDKIDENENIVQNLQNLYETRNLESTVETNFTSLLTSISTTYGLRFVVSEKIKYCVGGLLADSDLAVTGITDNSFRSHTKASGYILVTEAKTRRSFPVDHHWYKKSRSIQTVAAHRAALAPCLLYNQNDYKLLIPYENNLYVYPSDWFTSGRVYSRDFLFALAYVLKSGNKQNPAPPLRLPTWKTPEEIPRRKRQAHSATKTDQDRQAKTRRTSGRKISPPDYYKMSSEGVVENEQSGFSIDSLWSMECPDIAFENIKNSGKEPNDSGSE